MSEVDRALQAQRVYEALDAVIQALGALKVAIGDMVLATDSDDE